MFFTVIVVNRGYISLVVPVFLQEGVGDVSSGDSGASLRDAVHSFTWRFVPHCIHQERPHLVLFRSVLLHINDWFLLQDVHTYNLKLN